MATYEIPTASGYKTVTAEDKASAIQQVSQTDKVALNKQDQYLQGLANKNPEQADNIMNNLGYYTTPIINANIIKPTTPTYTTEPNKTYTNTQIQTDITANKPQVTPPVVDTQVQEQRNQVGDYLKSILGRDLSGEKANLREQAGLQAKLDEANRLQNELKTTKKSYEDQIKEIEKNKEGKFGGAVEQDVADLRRKANEDLANIAIQAEFANNNYTGAEKILNAQIQDLNDEYDMSVKNYQLAQDFLQNDLTESEKLTIQNNLALEKEKRDNAEYRLRAQFDAGLKASGINGQKELSSPQQTKVDSLNAVSSQIDNYRNLINLYTGSSGLKLTGEQAAQLRSAKAALEFAIAQASGTGALQAADRAVVADLIPDATSILSAGGVIIRGGKSGSLSALDQAKNIFNSMKQSITTGTSVPVVNSSPETLRAKYNY